MTLAKPSKFILVPNEDIDALCEVLSMKLSLRTIFENPVLGECKKTLNELAKLQTDSLVSYLYKVVFVFNSFIYLLPFLVPVSE